MNSSSRTFNSTALVLIASLIVYSLFVITSHHHERITGDATLYLSIAEKYVRGDFANAINGYWGPLLSWLLVPFLFLGASHLFAINALNLLFGLLTMTGVWRLSLKFELREEIRTVIILPLVPVLLFISLIQPMDYLLLCVLVFYLNVVFRKDYPERLSYGVTSGVLGACAYFSKPFGFPFFISHFILINLCHYFRGSSGTYRKKVFRNALIGLVVFSLLSSVWIGLISSKYNRLTFSNMGRGVLSSLGPESKHDTLEKGDPIFFKGFFEPPNESAFVIYEDPTYARKKIWNPLESKRSLSIYIRNISNNFFESLRIYESYSRLSVSIVIACVILILFYSLNRVFTRRELLYPLMTITLYTGGYLPFHFETRYLWIVNILLLLMGGIVLNEVLRRDFFRKRTIKIVITMVFVLSFIVSPAKYIVEMKDANINSEMYTLGAELGSRYDISGNIASNRQKVTITTHDSWHKTFRLAYWLQSRYYGQPRDNITDEELEEDFRFFDIDYYFYWGDPVGAPPFLAQFRELSGGDLPDLRIYSLKEEHQNLFK